MSNLINCGTCGYPLTPEERTTLVEKDGVMVTPESIARIAALEKALTQAVEALEFIPESGSMLGRYAQDRCDEAIANARQTLK